ncbi:unnamed protein product [Sphagnum balticum]
MYMDDYSWASTFTPLPFTKHFPEPLARKRVCMQPGSNKPLERKRREEALTSLNSGIVPGIAWHEWNPYREEKAQRQHTHRNKNTHSERKHKTRRSEEAQGERRAEEERRHSRSSSHPATGFSGRSDPFSTPHTGRWRPGEPLGKRVGTFRRRPGETGGRGGRYLPHQPGRRPGESVGLVVDTRYLAPPLAQVVTGRTGGREGQELLLGGLAIDTQSRV